jgi:hypothetical protein
MNEYTTDVRELDNLYLATIAGVDYYEVRQVVRRENGVRSIVGRASDWPLIKLTAENAELAALLVASEGRSVEADCHVAELLARLSAYEEQITALEAEKAEQAFKAVAADLKAQPTEFVEAPIPAPIEQLVKRLQAPKSAPGAELSTDVRRKCPYCTSRPKVVGLQAHIERAHPEHVTVVAVPTVPPIALELGEPPWRCAQCHTDAHARSLKDSARCIRCVVEAAEHTNGHLLAA